MNRAMVTALATIGIAQSLKIPINKAQTDEWDAGIFLETGGMPSSHSAGVTALATYVAHDRGICSIDFALSTVFGLIVMYDAQGIRRQTGELTIKVNEMDEELRRLSGLHKEGIPHLSENSVKLRERLGHMPEEVVGGALLGLITGSIGYALSRKKNGRSGSKLIKLKSRFQ